MKFLGRGLGGLSFLFAGILLAGCETGPQFKYDPLVQSTDPNMPTTAAAATAMVPTASADPTMTLVHLGDVINVGFADVPNAPPAIEDTIKEDGTITLPYNQKFLAAGKTIGALQTEIRERYVPTYWKYLTVSIRIQDRFYFVDGEVKAPGRQVYVGTMTVLKAISTVGGFTDFAAKGSVKVTRVDGTYFKENCRKALNGSAPDQQIFPGDRIYVPKRWF